MVFGGDRDPTATHEHASSQTGLNTIMLMYDQTFPSTFLSRFLMKK